MQPKWIASSSSCCARAWGRRCTTRSNTSRGTSWRVSPAETAGGLQGVERPGGSPCHPKRISGFGARTHARLLAAGRPSPPPCPAASDTCSPEQRAEGAARLFGAGARAALCGLWLLHVLLLPARAPRAAGARLLLSRVPACFRLPHACTHAAARPVPCARLTARYPAHCTHTGPAPHQLSPGGRLCHRHRSPVQVGGHCGGPAAVALRVVPQRRPASTPSASTVRRLPPSASPAPGLASSLSQPIAAAAARFALGSICVQHA